MDAARQREIASAGGKAAHRTGRAHRFTSDSGSAAGSRGGTTTSQDRSHMAEIGRLGGLASSRKRRAT